MKEEDILKKRFLELAERSYETNTFKFTDFLGLLEQNLFEEIKKEIYGIKYTAFGGVEGAERVMIRFGDPQELGYEEDFPISCVKIQPCSPKFADRLTHRDFLGALLNLGIERDKLGDIAIIDNCAYLFAKSDIAEYVAASLERVKHTDVKLGLVPAPKSESLYRLEEKRLQIQSERLDAVIAKLFKISRESSALLFQKGAVFINGRVCESVSKHINGGDVVSVRGYGRFIYRGFESETRKGKLNCVVELYL